MTLRGPARLAALLAGCGLLVMPSTALAAPPAAEVPAVLVVESHAVRDGMASAGSPRGIVAHVFTAADEPVPAQEVQLRSRPAAGGAWSVAGLATTDAHGAANFVVTPTAATVYAAHHLASTAAGPELTLHTRPSPGAPGTPGALYADPADGAAHAIWAPPTDDGGSAIIRYDVTARPANAAGPLTTVSVGPDAREATVTGLTNGTTYAVSVAAVNAYGSAGHSVDVTPAADAPPWPAEPVGGTKVCGVLPPGTTTWNAAGSPYHVCRLGVRVDAGSTLEVTGAEVRFAASPRPAYQRPRAGLRVFGGGVRIADSLLRGAAGRPGEWDGIPVDEYNDPGWHWPTPGRTSSTLSLVRSTVRHATDAVWLAERASYLDLTDTLLADGTGAGLRVDGSAVRARGLAVRDVGGDGLSLTCRAPGPAGTPCPVRLDGARVERAAGRGLLVDTAGPAAVRGVVVTGSGTRAPVSEAARITTLTGTYGAGGDVEDVTGGGNGVDAVLLDMTHTRDLVWRTPVAGSAAAPAPLGFLAGRVTMAPGRSVSFPPGSVVKAVEEQPERPECYSADFVPHCRAAVAVTDGALDAAPGTIFTSAHDATAGVTTCPSAFATKCGTGTSWVGLFVSGTRATVTLTGATVRHARFGLYVNGFQPAGGPGAAVTLTDTTITGGGDALHVRGSMTTPPTGSLTATGLTVDGPRLSAVTAYGLATTTLRGTTVRNAPEGVRLDGSDWTGTCASPARVTVDGLLVENVRRYPVELHDVCRPVVRSVTVRRSAPAGPDDVVAAPAVDLRGTYSVGPGRDVDGFTGGGNGMDAVSLSGVVVGDLAWVSPRNDLADHPLGYVLGPGPENLALRGGTLTVPAGGLVASLGLLGYGNANGLLTLHDAALDATAGGARLVSARDPLAAELGCRPCATTQWGGIRAVGPTEHETARAIRLHGATIRGGYVRSDSPTAEFSLTSSTTDQPVHVRRPDRLVVTDSRLGQFEVTGALHADVSRNTFTGPYTGVVLYGRGRTTPSDIALRDNVATAAVEGPAYVLANAHVRLGEAGTVHGNLGSGDSAALLLAGVTTAHDLRWVSPTNEPHPHPVGYIAAGYPVDMPDPLTVEGRTLTLPAGAVMKVAGTVLLRGGRLDATAGGALITPVFDGSAGVGCGRGWRHECQDPAGRDVSDVLRIEAVPQSPTGYAGGVALRGARVNGAVWVDRANDAPGAPGYGLTLDSSYVGGGLRSFTSTATITRSRIRHATAHLSGDSGPAHVVRDTTFEDMLGDGLSLSIADARVTESAFVGTARDEWHGHSAAVRVWNGTVAMSCLDVRGNGNGLWVVGERSTVTDSALTGNAGARPDSYDLDNEADVTTTRVWWGQPGGPKAGQVRDPGRHTDVSPAAAKPACAVAESVAPPSAPRSVTATGADNAVTAQWAAPAEDGGAPVSEYRVTVSPSGATRYLPATARSVTIGVTPGTTYAVSVTAVNAAGAGPRSRFSLPVHAGEAGRAPVAATLTATAPALVTYGTDAVVTGTLASADGPLAGRLVELRVRRAGTTSWGAPVATLVTSPTGTVTRPLRLAANSDVLLTFAGDATALGTESAVRRVAVRPAITAAFSRATTTYGTSVTLSGRVYPALAGRPVRLERYTTTGWQRVARTYLTATSAYRFTVRPPKRGTLHYRVVYDATAAHARGVSPTRALRVS